MLLVIVNVGFIMCAKIIPKMTSDNSPKRILLDAQFLFMAVSCSAVISRNAWVCAMAVLITGYDFEAEFLGVVYFVFSFLGWILSCQNSEFRVDWIFGLLSLMFGVFTWLLHLGKMFACLQVIFIDYMGEEHEEEEEYEEDEEYEEEEYEEEEDEGEEEYEEEGEDMFFPDGSLSGNGD